MDRKYYLGIDGGGTKTAFIVIDENNEMVYQNVLGPSSLDTVPLIDIEKLLLAESKNIPYKISAIFAGIGTGVAFLVGVIVIMTQVFDIATCLTFPETVL